jgi:hypothetical protein
METTKKEEECPYAKGGRCKCEGCKDCKANADKERKLNNLSDISTDNY